MPYEGESSFSSILRTDWGSVVPLLDFMTRPKSLLMTLGTPRRTASASSGMSAIACTQSRSSKLSSRVANRPRCLASCVEAAADGLSSMWRNNNFPDDPEEWSASVISNRNHHPYQSSGLLGPYQSDLPSVPEKWGSRETPFFVALVVLEVRVLSFINQVVAVSIPFN